MLFKCCADNNTKMDGVPDRIIHHQNIFHYIKQFAHYYWSNKQSRWNATLLTNLHTCITYNNHKELQNQMKHSATPTWPTACRYYIRKKTKKLQLLKQLHLSSALNLFLLSFTPQRPYHSSKTDTKLACDSSWHESWKKQQSYMTSASIIVQRTSNYNK